MFQKYPLSPFSPFMTATPMCQRRRRRTDVFAISKNVLSSFKAEMQPAGHLFSTGDVKAKRRCLPELPELFDKQIFMPFSFFLSGVSETTEMSSALAAAEAVRGIRTFSAPRVEKT